MIITRLVSRFSRNMGEYLSIINLLKQMGIPVIFEKEHINSMEPKSELFLSILATMAQEESNHISMNLKWAYSRRAELGIPNRRCPYRIQKGKTKRK